MRPRIFIALLAIALMLPAVGCSWYDAFCQKFGGASAPAKSRVETEKDEARQPD
jgi:hypothetical protein